jgi:hypothetical protein
MEFWIQINGSSARLTVRHPGTIKNFKHILSLGEKETRGSVLNMHSKKVIQLSEIFQGKLMLECTIDPLK